MDGVAGANKPAVIPSLSRDLKFSRALARKSQQGKIRGSSTPLRFAQNDRLEERNLWAARNRPDMIGAGHEPVRATASGTRRGKPRTDGSNSQPGAEAAVRYFAQFASARPLARGTFRGC